MTFKSPRNRPICRDQACDVEIHAGEKYCAAHSWRIGKWLEESRDLLIQALKDQWEGNHDRQNH